MSALIRHDPAVAAALGAVAHKDADRLRAEAAELMRQAAVLDDRGDLLTASS